MSAIYIGTSGWSYQHWKENFFPNKLPTTKWLNYYAQTFPTVEINTTFYHLPLEKTVVNWYQQVPSQFLFAVKASRYITHIKRLRNCQESVDLFMKKISSLKDKKGPILFQLPPSLQMDLARLQSFLSYLPKKEKFVLEFRHASWFVDDIYTILSDHNIALCITDLNGTLSPEMMTANFSYIRLHGPKKAYQGSYGLANLKKWQKKIEKWGRSQTVFCYFDNDEKGYAIQDASSLQGLLTGEAGD
ncbi:MAG: DUF72 domain-containing protein [Parachlamydiaceae bacterium]